MNWTLFATIIAQIDAPVASAVNAMFGALISYVEPAFRAALIGYVTFRLLQEAIAPRAEPWNVAVMTLMKGAAVYSFLLGAGAYGHYVQALFMDGLPNEITRVVSSAVGNAPITTSECSSNHRGRPAPLYGYGDACWPECRWACRSDDRRHRTGNARLVPNERR
jgi:hypothetical protein